jgi:16S rRNA U516 pseudouridylate synthase RsuA-like enzyme
VRVRFGSLGLGALAPGESRRLDPGEVERLWKDARSMATRRASRGA